MRKIPLILSLVVLLAGCATGDMTLDGEQSDATGQPSKSADSSNAESAPQPELDDPVEPEEPSAWGVISEIAELPYEGVSAHLEATELGYRLFYASMTAGGQVVSDCDATLSCETQAVLDRMSDLTLVRTGSEERRGFWVEMNPDTRMKEIYTGLVSEDGTNVLNRTPLGFSGDISWGVPDAVTLPDGRVRIYWVEPGNGRASERIVSATSTDNTGAVFERDPGFRLEGGWVDFEVLVADQSEWLAIMSSSPETLPQKPQGIFLARSKNGLEWEINDTNLTPADMSYLDPTGVQNPDGTFTIVMSVAPNELGTRDYKLVSAKLNTNY